MAVNVDEIDVALRDASETEMRAREWLNLQLEEEEMEKWEPTRFTGTKKAEITAVRNFLVTIHHLEYWRNVSSDMVGVIRHLQEMDRGIWNLLDENYQENGDSDRDDIIAESRSSLDCVMSKIEKLFNDFKIWYPVVEEFLANGTSPVITRLSI